DEIIGLARRLDFTGRERAPDLLDIFDAPRDANIDLTAKNQTQRQFRLSALDCGPQYRSVICTCTQHQASHPGNYTRRSKSVLKISGKNGLFRDFLENG